MTWNSKRHSQYNLNHATAKIFVCFFNSYSNSAVVNGESSSKAGLTLSAANENDCVAKEEEEADRTV